MSEAESLLLKRFVDQGDSEAFTEIVRQYAGLVYSACHRILDDADKAADAAQETFLQLLRNAHCITDSLPGWLHRVATHLAIDRVRKDTTRRKREAQYADNLREVHLWQDISTSVDEALDRLDEPTRDILIRHFFQAQTTRKIGEQIGVSQATVSRRIDAGVIQLREKLRTRGMILSVAVLGSLLGEHVVQAAPAIVLKELGKLALVGSQIATATGAGTTAATAKASTGSILVGVKVKFMAVTAVAALGVGSVVTYQHISRPPARTNIIVDTEDRLTKTQTPTEDNSNENQANSGGLAGGFVPWRNDNSRDTPPSEEDALVTENEVIDMGIAEDISGYGGLGLGRGGIGGGMDLGGGMGGGMGIGGVAPPDYDPDREGGRPAAEPWFGVDYRDDSNEPNKENEP